MIARLRNGNSVQIQNTFLTFLLTAIIVINWSSSHFAISFSLPHVISKPKTFSYSRSAVGLQRLVSADLHIVKIITDNLSKLPHKSYLQRASEMYVADMMRGNGFTLMDNNTGNIALKIAQNPIASYRTIRRIVTLLGDLSFHAKEIIELPDQKVLKLLYRGLPDQNDLNQAMDGILRLHMIYDFDIKLFSNGNISGVWTGAELNAVHCYEIGVYGMKTGYYAQAVDWLEAALQKITIDEDSTIDKGIVTTAFMDAVNKHDEEYSKLHRLEPYFFDTKIASMTEKGDFSYRKTGRNIQYHTLAGKIGRKNSDPNYWSLCSGNNHQVSKLSRVEHTRKRIIPMQTLEEKSELFCWLESKAHEEFYIGPIKMEFLARNPDVVQVYDVLTSGVIKQIQTDTTESMVGSYVVTSTGNPAAPQRRFQGNGRTSESSRLSETFRNEYVKLVSTISHLTGLRAAQGTSGEDIQVSSYAFSGHFLPHLDADASEYFFEGRGNRIATFMIYLSDVEIGGQTAFPHIGTATKPVKGSAVFWYNILRNGQPDVLTFHGGCPVVIGHKYVANKWIRSYDQFLTHKCSKNFHERFQFAVNKMYSPVSEVSKLLSIKRNDFKKLDGRRGTNMAEKNFAKYSYRSPSALKSLVATEQSIYKIIKLAYTELGRNISIGMKMDPKFMKNLLLVQTYLKDFEDSTGKLLSEDSGTNNYNTKNMPPSTRISWNPIAAYRMIWRVTNILKHWVFDNDLLLGTSFQETAEEVKRLYKESDGPDAIDLKEATSALMNLQYVYNLNATDMAFGVVANKQSGIRLNALHCYEIGMEGISDAAYTVGINWLETALFLVKSKADSSISLVQVEKTLKEAKDTHDKNYAISEGWEPFFFYKTFSSNKDHVAVRRLTRKAVSYRAFRFKEEPNYAEINYNGICSGWPHQTPEEKSKLFCWYEHKIHPFWKLNPLKAEIHSLRPKLEIVRYYNLLSDKVIINLKESAELKIKTYSGSLGDPRFKDHYPKMRSSVDSWLSENESKDVAYVSKLIERITGLNVADNFHDKLQISAYSPGVYDDVHTDIPHQTPGESRAKRIASFKLYLSDVKMGGFTAFSQAGVKIIPEKGSGVFWYNLYSSGHPNHRTYHGDCPVVFGENWIANKWMLYESQIKHTCHIHKSTPDEILVNGKSKYSSP